MLFRVVFKNNTKPKLNQEICVSFCEDRLKLRPCDLNKFLFNFLHDHKLICNIVQEDFFTEVPLSFGGKKEVNCYVFNTRRKRRLYCTLLSFSRLKINEYWSDYSGQVNNGDFVYSRQAAMASFMSYYATNNTASINVNAGTNINSNGSNYIQNLVDYSVNVQGNNVNVLMGGNTTPRNSITIGSTNNAAGNIVWTNAINNQTITNAYPVTNQTRVVAADENVALEEDLNYLFELNDENHNPEQ